MKAYSSWVVVPPHYQPTKKQKTKKKYELNDVFLFKDPSQIKIPYYD